MIVFILFLFFIYCSSGQMILGSRIKEYKSSYFVSAEEKSSRGKYEAADLAVLKASGSLRFFLKNRNIEKGKVLLGTKYWENKEDGKTYYYASVVVKFRKVDIPEK